MATVTTMCAGRTAIAATREEALAHFYACERNAGADPLTANERMLEFSKRLDAEYERDLAVISEVLKRTK